MDKEFPDSYRTFIADNGIRHHVFNMKGTKKEDIPIKTMKSILRLVLDPRNHPLLIHCNHGKVGKATRTAHSRHHPSSADKYCCSTEPAVW